MSIAIANTQNNLGTRTLGTYNPRTVRRGPAEPGPRSAENPVTLGIAPILPGTAYSHLILAPGGVDSIRAIPSPILNPIIVSGVYTPQGPVSPPLQPSPILGEPIQNPIAPVTTPIIPLQPLPPTLNPNGTASQNPTGSTINGTLPINSQIVPSTATPTGAPVTSPTATATVAPATAPGYVVINSGGGTTSQTSPDYVSEIEQWLSASSLIAGVPNWLPLLGAVVIVGFVWGERGKRR